MREDSLELTVRYRALKAVAVVMSLLLMVPGIEVLFRMTHASPDSVAIAGGLDSRALVQEGDPYATLDQIEQFASASEGELTDALSMEVGLMPGAQEVRVDATGSVLGYVVDGDVGEIEGRLRGSMESRGWVAVELGGVEGATFVKSDGAYTWALATCTQVDQSTSVVVRCMGS